jgi:hypothetical protein
MKGDFSRIRFTPKEHFTSVLEQQGRVSLDADANEQRAIDEYLRRTEIVDAIGAVGGPSGKAGFKITVEDSTIRISGGRYYVQGLLCEGTATDYMDQPFLISPSVTDAEYLDELAQGNIDAICLELQVWQRLVTALDDPCLLEPALGQADTTARLQTVWRVVASPIQSQDTLGTASGVATSQPGGGLQLLGQLRQRSLLINKQQPTLGTISINRGNASEASLGTIQEKIGRLCVQLNPAGDDCSCQPIPPAGYQGLENQLYRIEIHHGGDASTATFKWSRENASIVAAVTSYSGTNAQTIFVDSLGRDANLGFAANQWVEISDDTTEFGDTPNQPGQLCQISSVSAAGQPPSITFMTTVPTVDPARNARVRRWDQPGTGIAGDIPLSTTAPIDIENGIQVTFTAGTYKSGDYWLIPARTASGTIDWPPCGGDGATCQPPATVPIYTAPLALITSRFSLETGVNQGFSPVETDQAGLQLNSSKLEAATGKFTERASVPVAVENESDFLVRDLRSLFSPLASTALHVSRINWTNDDVVTLDQLAVSGLKLLLDDAPTSIIDSSVFRVTVEIPAYNAAGTQRATLSSAPFASSNPTGAAPGQSQPTLQITQATKLRTEFVLDGVVTVTNDIVSWQLLDPNSTNKVVVFLGDLTFLELNALLQSILYAPDPTWFARVRVRLLGHMIYAQASSSSGGCGQARTLFLDGQCFATPGTRADQTPRIALQYPSGIGAAASDFESWFYLAPAVTVSSVLFNPASITLVGGTPTGSTAGTVTLGTPVPADTTVTLTATPPAGLEISVPATITVPAGQNSQTFTANFTVTAPTAGAGVIGTVSASVAWKVGTGSNASGTFTVIAPNK